MAARDIPGLAVAVLRDGQVVTLQGHGVANLGRDEAVTADTAFQTASVTKLFTGVLTMRLVERGRLGLDEPVSAYVDDLPESWRAITVRQLATHQSGVPDAMRLGRAFASADDAVRAAAAELPLDFAPGTRTGYASADYALLTMVLERAGGRPFDELLRDEVLAPIGATATSFEPAGETRRATVYVGGAGEDGTRATSDVAFPHWFRAAGGVYSSAADLARLFGALHDGRLLGEASIEQMWSAPALADGTPGGFGVGWVVGTHRGRRAIGHSGGPALADVLHLPDGGLTVIVLTNQLDLYPHLARNVADLFVPRSVIPAAGIDDAEPALTARLRRVVEDAGQGRVSEEDFTPEARPSLVPGLRHIAPRFVGALGPLTAFVLVERRVDGSGPVRLTYAALHGDRPVRWTFAVDDEGRIAAVQPKEE